MPLRPRILLSALVLLLVSCSGGDGSGGEGSADPAPDSTAGPASPPPGGAGADSASISVGPSVVPPGGSVEVAVQGYPPGSTLEIGFGPPSSEFEVVGSLAVGAGGGGTTRAGVPGYAESGQTYVLVAQQAGGVRRTVSDPFLVVAAGDTVTVQGRLTGEGVECPALRSPVGVLYALAGGVPAGVEPGAEVEVRATVPDMSICMQGIPLSVLEATPR